MSQEIKIGVTGDGSGAEKMLDGIARKADQVNAKVNSIGSGSAGGGGGPGTWGDMQSQFAEARRELLRVGEERIQRTKATQDILSRERGRPVSIEDTDRFLGNFDRMRSRRTIGTGKLRAYNSFESWYKGHADAFKTADAAERHRRFVFSLGMQGTDDVEDHRGGGGDEGGGGGGGRGGGGWGNGLRKASSSGMSFLRGGLALAGIGSIFAMAAKGVNSGSDEAIGTDTLKRRLGDLGVDFDRLRDQTRRASEGLGITYVESVRLGQQFAREAGNLRAGDVASGGFGRTLRTAEGFSRSYGLEPEQGVALFGTMRRTGADGGTDQGDRRLALMISDTITRSGYAGKADEIVDAISKFADQQARYSVQRPNIGAYAGALSSLTGTGLSGLDPAGAAGILGASDSAFRKGGARGEASKNALYAALMGSSPGMSPMAVQGLMEGGLFATTRSTFGEGSALKGLYSGPLDDTTNFSKARSMFSRMYPNRGYRLNALSNTFGLSMGQASAYDSMSDDQANGSIGLLRRAGVNESSVNPTGLATISRLASGGVGDMRSVYDSLMKRREVSDTDKAGLRKTLAGGDVETLRTTLAKLVAAYGQESTDGDKTRKSISDVENKLTEIGGEVIKLLNPIRSAAVAIAEIVVPGFKTGEAVGRERAKEAAGHDYATQYRGLGANFGKLLDADLTSDRRRFDDARRKAGGGRVNIDSIVGRPPDNWAASNPNLYAETMARRQALERLQPAPAGSAVSSDDANWMRLGTGVSGGATSTGRASFVRPYTGQQAREIAGQTLRPSQYDAMFQAAGRKYGVDWRMLKARAVSESRMRPGAQGVATRQRDGSIVQALGLMQVTDANGRNAGLSRGDLLDPAKNIDLGSKLYSEALRSNGGDYHKADLEYYGGKKGQGPNSQQYAANGDAVRGQMSLLLNDATIYVKDARTGATLGQTALKPTLKPKAQGTR